MSLRSKAALAAACLALVALAGCGDPEVEAFRKSGVMGRDIIEFTSPSSNSSDPVLGCRIDVQGYQQECRFFRAANKMLMADREKMFIDQQGRRVLWPRGSGNEETQRIFRGLWASSQAACKKADDPSRLRIGVHHLAMPGRTGGVFAITTIRAREYRMLIEVGTNQLEEIHLSIATNNRDLTEYTPAGEVKRVKCEGL